MNGFVNRLMKKNEPCYVLFKCPSYVGLCSSWSAFFLTIKVASKHIILFILTPTMFEDDITDVEKGVWGDLEWIKWWRTGEAPWHNENVDP